VATGRTIITRAMRLIGALGATETPQAEDVNDGLASLNEFVSTLATQRLTIFQVDRVVVPLTADQPSYTIGPGGDIDRPRPHTIENVGLVLDRTQADPVELNLGPPMADIEWQGTQIKDLAGSYPSAAYFDHAFTTPAGLARVFVYPVPNQSSSDLVLYIPRAMSQFADLDTDYALPDGYARMLRYNLAVEIAPEYDVPVPPRVEEVAASSLAAIKRANFRPRPAGLDPALFANGVGRFNIRTGA
jgi:hypothetical protein